MRSSRSNGRGRGLHWLVVVVAVCSLFILGEGVRDYWAMHASGAGFTGVQFKMLMPHPPENTPMVITIGLYPSETSSTSGGSGGSGGSTHMVGQSHLVLQTNTKPPAPFPVKKDTHGTHVDSNGFTVTRDGSEPDIGPASELKTTADPAPEPGTQEPGSLECVFSEETVSNTQTHAKKKDWRMHCGAAKMQRLNVDKAANKVHAEDVDVIHLTSGHVERLIFSVGSSGGHQNLEMREDEDQSKDGGPHSPSGDEKYSPPKPVVFHRFQVSFQTNDAQWAKKVQLDLKSVKFLTVPGNGGGVDCPHNQVEETKHESAGLHGLVHFSGWGKLQKSVVDVSAKTRQKVDVCTLPELKIGTLVKQASGDDSDSNDTDGAVGEDEDRDEILLKSADYFDALEEQEAAEAAANDAASASSSSGGGSAAGTAVGVLAALAVVAAVGGYLYMKKRKAAAAAAGEGRGVEGAAVSKAATRKVKHTRLEETNTTLPPPEAV